MFSTEIEFDQKYVFTPQKNKIHLLLLRERERDDGWIADNVGLWCTSVDLCKVQT